jgi:hypothetical protein
MIGILIVLSLGAAITILAGWIFIQILLWADE